jgi:hypothetical protein
VEYVFIIGEDQRKRLGDNSGMNKVIDASGVTAYQQCGAQQLVSQSRVVSGADRSRPVGASQGVFKARDASSEVLRGEKCHQCGERPPHLLQVQRWPIDSQLCNGV